MKRQNHITALKREIEENIDLLIAHSMAGHTEDCRLTAACLRGSRHKLTQLLRWDISQVTQVERRIPVVKNKGLHLASSAFVYGIVALIVSALVAVGVWFYSFKSSF